MAKQGTYDVNEGPGGKDTSFRSFVCALLIFMAMCVIIFLILAFVKPGGGKHGDESAGRAENDAEVFENTSGPSKSEKLLDGSTESDIDVIEHVDTTAGYEAHTRKTTVKQTPTTAPNYEDTPLEISTRRYQYTTIPPIRIISTTDNSVEYKEETIGIFTRGFQDTTVPARSTSTYGPRVTTDNSGQTIEAVTVNSTTEDNRGSTHFMPFQATTDNSLSTEQWDTFDITTAENNETVDIGIDSDLFHFTSTTVDVTGVSPTTDIPNQVMFQSDTTTAESYSTTTEINWQTVQNDSSTPETATSNFLLEIVGSSSTTDVSDQVALQNGATTTENEDTTTETDQQTDVSPTEVLTTEFFSTRSGWVNVFNRFTTIPDTTTEALSATTMKSAASTITPNPVIFVKGNSPTTNIPYTISFDDDTTTSVNSESTTEIDMQSETTESLTLRSITTQSPLSRLILANYNQTTQVVTVETTTPAPQTTVVRQLTTTPASTTTVGNRGTINSVKNINVPQSEIPTCKTVPCKNTASRLLYLMDHQVDPCSNFYEFSCGGHELNNEIEESKNLKLLIKYMEKINGSESYLYKFKTFYKSCVKFEASMDMLKKLEFLHPFPSNMNISEVFAELILTQSMPLFDFGLDIEKDSLQYKIELTLPDSSSLTTRTKGWSILEQIRQECLKSHSINIKGDLEYVISLMQDCVQIMLSNIAHNFVREMVVHFPNGDDTVFKEETVKNMLLLISWVQGYPNKDTIQILANKKPVISNIAELNTTLDFDLVDWSVVFRKLNLTGALDQNRSINVYLHNEFRNLFQKLRIFNESELIDALWLYSQLQLYINTVIPIRQYDRETYCMNLAKQLIPDTATVIAYKLSDRGALHDKTLKAHDLFEQLRTTLKDSLSNLTNHDSVEALRGNLEKVTLKFIAVGDEKSAKANSMSLNINEDDFQSNLVELLRNYRKIIYSLDSTSATAASLLRYFVDPFYDRPKSFYPSNLIVAHPTIFKNNPSMLPFDINLATIGFHMSHELVKHILQEYFLAGGPDFYKTLVHNTRSLLDHYISYKFDFREGSVTYEKPDSVWVHQMLVDNGAFRLIYNVFDNTTIFENLPWMWQDYNAQKVFFIAAVQEHCRQYTASNFIEDIYLTGNLPLPLKIQNIISNSREFSDTFNCRDGSDMKLPDPDTMIAQFPYVNSEDEYPDYGNTPYN